MLIYKHPSIKLNMNKKLLGLFFLALLPTIIQFIAKLFESYSIGLILRIISHIIIPVIAVAYITNITLKESFLLPLKLKNKKNIWYYSFIFSIGAVFIITLAYFLLGQFIDFSNIAEQLKTYNVTKSAYPLVALAIIFINPFLEEYFWRGFVFRVFDKYSTGYWTGILFAFHHVIIVAGWFNWWQFLLVTLFLAIIGMLFNFIYKKTESIYASWIIHTIGDIVIVLIGYFVVFG